MHLPRSPLISDDHLYVSGNVTIDPSAAIATSVMLQADPGCQLIIAAGVSIGSGCVLHAHQGILEIGIGATLGSGVLIVGKGKIGANACVGSMATLINSSIAPGYAVPPGAVIGDLSRQTTATAPQTPPTPPATEPSAPAATPAVTNGKTNPVYGQVYLERMMVMMFPHRQKLENPSSDD
jgi:carbon dioxide concentrating mechanism protein CcmN